MGFVAPAANMAIQLWGEKTGAFEAVLSNDLDNLKYPKIKEFDAVFLNNSYRSSPIQWFRGPDALHPGRRRPGGRLPRSAASIDWAEFGDMLAAGAGSHRSPQESQRRWTIRITETTEPGGSVTCLHSSTTWPSATRAHSKQLDPAQQPRYCDSSRESNQQRQDGPLRNLGRQAHHLAEQLSASGAGRFDCSTISRSTPDRQYRRLLAQAYSSTASAALCAARPSPPASAPARPGIHRQICAGRCSPARFNSP
jgi:hypothetical protein